MASNRTIELLIVISAKLIMGAAHNRTTNLLCLKTNSEYFRILSVAFFSYPVCNGPNVGTFVVSNAIQTIDN